jgi:3-methyladenine DNA glycosylase AlkD
MTVQETLRQLKSHGSARNVEGMRRYGITAKKAFGVPAPVLRELAKRIGKDQELSLQLWKTGVLEARLLAALIGEPERTTRRQMDRWVRDFDSWAVCDTCCGNLFDKTPYAYEQAFAWCKRKEEFVRRAGFVMMAELAVHDKAASDAKFMAMLPKIRAGATDGRNFVKKAVNWALRQIGKRNATLHRVAMQTAVKIARIDMPSARWIAADALRELRSESVRRRLRRN